MTDVPPARVAEPVSELTSGFEPATRIALQTPRDRHVPPFVDVGTSLRVGGGGPPARSIADLITSESSNGRRPQAISKSTMPNE